MIYFQFLKSAELIKQRKQHKKKNKPERPSSAHRRTRGLLARRSLAAAVTGVGGLGAQRVHVAQRKRHKVGPSEVRGQRPSKPAHARHRDGTLHLQP